MEEKGLNEAIDVVQAYVQQLINVFLNTLLLPFRVLDAFLD